MKAPIKIILKNNIQHYKPREINSGTVIFLGVHLEIKHLPSDTCDDCYIKTSCELLNLYDSSNSEFGEASFRIEICNQTMIFSPEFYGCFILYQKQE